ncbi:hypothetical protein SKAU_G00057240 [Synaphobranchus kaupii]|uniref:OTU domain-containing protein n=1 Tax=Synaphobranchus kaupii TaxID=118154 RepID=A0A9Q1G584_SYNKA|nr:hypothetical protein SKAU_G00057240 [Synaphobranchus kaupii]
MLNPAAERPIIVQTESETTGSAKLPGVYGYVSECLVERKQLKLNQVTHRTDSGLPKPVETIQSLVWLCNAVPFVDALGLGSVFTKKGERHWPEMGNWCEKQTEEEEEKLLDDSKKDTDSLSKESEESDRERGGFENEDGDDADSSGTHGSREIGSMAKLDTVLTVVQVNQDVGSEVHNLEIADNKCPEVSSPKAEDLQTAAHNQKINERNVEDEKTGKEPLTGTQDMKAKDPTPRTVDGPTVGPNAVFPDEASTHADHEPCMGNLSRPAHEEAAELVSSALLLEGDSEREDHDSEGDAPAAVRQTSDVNDGSLGIKSSSQAKKPSLTDELGTSKRLEQEVRKDEGIGEEANEREDDEDKMTKACDNSSTQAQEEYSFLGSPLIVEVKTEPLKSTDEEADRPAHEEAAELVSSALHLEGDSEREDHDSEGDAPAAVRQTSDVNDGSLGINSSSQAKKPSLTDELGTSKRLEQEVRKDEGIGEEVNESSAMIVEEKTEPLKCPEPVKSTDGEADSDEDIYQAAEDIDKHEKIQITLPGVQDRSSVEPRVDILSYSQREWKGNTAKSALIRKGYSELSQCFEGLRKVRGDNYCALRATLFQVLCHSAKLPAWIEDDDITLLPEKLAAGMEPIKSWRFPLGHDEAEEKEGAVERLKHHLKLLQKTVHLICLYGIPFSYNHVQVKCAKKSGGAVAEAGGAEERRSLCEAIFRGGEEEHALLEAVKLLMLSTAAELHPPPQHPQTFLTNHLSHVGFSGGLEQVEMFLLGYALQHAIQVYRLYMVDTEEFITYYPNDHEEDWPHVCLVTEDDRHYNVLVGKLKGLDFPEAPTVD